MRLIRYLLEQYTNEEDLVLDPFIGSGTTAVACKYMKRHYLGFEIDPKFAQIAQERLTTKAWKQEATAPAPTTTPSDGLDEPIITDEPTPKPRAPTKTAKKKGK